MQAIQEQIIHVAKGYVGQQELKANSGFKDFNFQRKMAAVGWEKGFPWCAFFAELCWEDAYATQPALVKELERIFSGSAVETYYRFQQAGWTTGRTPVPGAVAAWRFGKSWQGHMGIVTGVSQDGTMFDTIEGNTSRDGGREGDTVWTKDRYTYPKFNEKGLNPLGFIYPK